MFVGKAASHDDGDQLHVLHTFNKDNRTSVIPRNVSHDWLCVFVRSTWKDTSMSYVYPLPRSTTNGHSLSIRQVLEAPASDAVAIAAPGRAPLTYGRLCIHIDHTVKVLNSMGLGRGDRIAIVLPNGPE